MTPTAYASTCRSARSSQRICRRCWRRRSAAQRTRAPVCTSAGSGRRRRHPPPPPEPSGEPHGRALLGSRPVTPLWERRFRAPIVSMPEWSPRAPDRVTFASNETGVWQLHALDMTTDMRRRVTDHPVGVTEGTPTLDGRGALWFQDESGDESGRWFVQPFEGGEPSPFLDSVPVGWNEGLSQGPGVSVACVSDRDGFHVYSIVDGEPARAIRESRESLTLGEPHWAARGFDRSGLSADGS